MTRNTYLSELQGVRKNVEEPFERPPRNFVFEFNIRSTFVERILVKKPFKLAFSRDLSDINLTCYDS